jgi:ribosomal protein L28
MDLALVSAAEHLIERNFDVNLMCVHFLLKEGSNKCSLWVMTEANSMTACCKSPPHTKPQSF